MLKSQNFSNFVLVLITGIIVAGSPSISQSESTTTITVVVLPGKDSCSCGSHMGSFNAMYNSNKISIGFSHSPNQANPIKHPIVVMKNNELIKNWDSLLCSPNCSSINGSKITIYGRWRKFEGSDFEAYKIDLIAPSAQNSIMSPSTQDASFNCSEAKTASEVAVCNNSDLSRMDKELALLYQSHINDYKNDPSIANKLRGTQRSWLVERNRCGSNVSCLRVRYQERIAWLREFEAYN
ncbi:MAG: hypothetical protein RKP73_11775 [Candidatus Contendobacter sp.]|nr:hypothetical protein [Candidatus Contendobacter sp.]